jgi:hypothetical protein
LREAIERSHQGYTARECVEAVDESCGPPAIENTLNKVREAGFVTFIGREPTRLLFALARRFDGIGLHPLDEIRIDAGQRPGTEQRLIDHVFVRR